MIGFSSTFSGLLFTGLPRTYVGIANDLNSAHQPWLGFDWDVDGVLDKGPVARATFGIFDRNPVQIYMQQIYQ